VVAIGKSLPDILDLVINTTTNIVDTLAQWGSTLLASFKNWFADVLPKIKEFGGDILDQLSDLPGEFKEIGKNLLTGLWEGIEDKLEWLKSQIKSIGSSVTKSAKKALGIKSPSRLWKEEIGKNLALGLGIGFEDEMDTVRGDMVDSMNGLTASMTTEVTAYGSGGASALGGTTYNGGNISINVYGAEGQNVNDLANAVAYKLEEMTKRRLAVYG
jgi:phage-related protein